MPRRRLPRFIVVALYGAAGAALGVAAAIFVIVSGAGVFWLFIFGDDTWPGWAEAALVIAGYCSALAIFLGAIALGWRRTGAR